MDAWEAYAVDAAEEQGDQPAEDAISKGLESLADSALISMPCAKMLRT